ncbi:hypothetical protein [Mobiluncus mulieris]|uniref:DUF4190 domain-containing protein n=2 Tax=Mobiluncus mulieris TaxID=2052 RepID=E0QMU0_9ACTO|nr:hypothetical protein [Mobiluncus mulieris]EEJ53173.1 hypothetical protein HMPREF0577_1848 [Mobiluncus mulieris ATCC 35243]EFM47107.1 hypothetical protein HMPREF0580_0204 [Mobiluncus mulieris ATCC 35239]EFN93659.1 hypothetical protein HMPREF9278_0434 [Mobiluncus mulieris FB024-16]MBB5847343.1 uncharacterized membrane protein YhaH (DUF805 family) [Mobiluncus mulieris]MCU9968923.1 hypothetical protein [Mobiluncus mulieris]
MSEGYVSHFPGTAEVDPTQVFVSSGYHEPQQQTSAVVIALFVASLVSLIPVFGSWISVFSLPAALALFQNRRLHDRQLPGNLLLRAAVGISVLGLGIGLASILPLLALSGTMN